MMTNRFPGGPLVAAGALIGLWQTAPLAAAPLTTATTPMATPTPTPSSSNSNWKIGGSERLREESYNWWKTPGFKTNYTFTTSTLRLFAAQSRDDRDLYIELEQPSLLGLPNHPASPAPKTGNGGAYFAANDKRDPYGLFVKQAYARWKPDAYPNSGVEGGRFTFNDGLEGKTTDSTIAWLRTARLQARLLGDYNWTVSGRSFDGGQLSHIAGGTTYTALAVRPTTGAYQVNGSGDLDINVLYASATRDGKHGEGRLFAIRYNDERNIAKTDNGPATTGHIGINTVGANYLHDFRAGSGKADIMAWGALQNGDWGGLRQSAYAYDTEAGYQPKMEMHPWLRAGFCRNSGDSNPADGTHGTFFSMLPTPRTYYPLYNQMNSNDLFGQLILRPDPKWTMRASAHKITLASATDDWYFGGGAFTSGTFGMTGLPSGGSTNLCNLYDLSLDHPLGHTTSITLLAAYVKGGSVIEHNFPTGANGVYAYAELNQKF